MSTLIFNGEKLLNFRIYLKETKNLGTKVPETSPEYLSSIF